MRDFKKFSPFAHLLRQPGIATHVSSLLVVVLNRDSPDFLRGEESGMKFPPH
jgi:hypothetical protein